MQCITCICPLPLLCNEAVRIASAHSVAISHIQKGLFIGFQNYLKNTFPSVFLQCLLLSQMALRQETSIGQIINLMTNDVNRFDDATVYFNYLWVSPIHVIITTTILYFVLGSSCFVGLLIIFILAYFQGDLLQ